MKKIIKNKHGWIRIVEAVIAVLLIAGVLSFVYFNKIYRPDREEVIYELEAAILDDIADNEDFRDEILNYDGTQSTEYVIDDILTPHINDQIPSYLGFRIQICEVNDVCGFGGAVEDYLGKDLYVDERIISYTLETQGTKKIKLFIWEK